MGYPNDTYAYDICFRAYIFMNECSNLRAICAKYANRPNDSLNSRLERDTRNVFNWIAQVFDDASFFKVSSSNYECRDYIFLFCAALLISSVA